jgi:DNA invertase Pin-like site-specific DNA recombinase
MVVLRESLSNLNGPFVKLMSLEDSNLFRTDKDTLTKDISPPSPQVKQPKPSYRMTRRLSPTELQQVIELYRLGLSTYKLARQFGTNRHTITGHLRRGGVALRSRHKLTPHLIEQAKQLYADGASLAVIGTQFGLSPTTIGTALTKAGVRLRDAHSRQT